jgi:hypothetical protein
MERRAGMNSTIASDGFPDVLQAEPDLRLV